ncbi:MAG: hypothetical protein M3459_11305 [Actinomycetota bacterium]|nr:hypothetical protein [Actinomycetota bacterium]
MKILDLLDQPPIWRAGLFGLEPARLVHDPTFRGGGLTHADGQPVLLVPACWPATGCGCSGPPELSRVGVA